MQRKRKYFIIPALVFLLIYFLVHLKNYHQVGYFNVVIKGDIFDKIFDYLIIPGLIPTFCLIMLIYHNIHNFDEWALETGLIIFNSLFYGFIFYFIWPLAKQLIIQPLNFWRQFRAYCIIIFILLSLLLSYFFCFHDSKNDPHVILAKDIKTGSYVLPADFELSGLTFFNNKVYVSSTIGLLEFEDGAFAKLYKWYDRDDVISGPWFDSSNNLLWVLHDGLFKLFRFDGETWKLSKVPEPPKGYTRGDILEGHRCSGNANSFWLEGGGVLWKWSNKKCLWETQPVPLSGSLAHIIPLNPTIYYIMRYEWMHELVDMAGKTLFKSDAVYFFDGEWKLVPNNSGINFFVENVCALNCGEAFLLTTTGQLLHLTPQQIDLMDTIGRCDAITVTSAGTLLASFYHSGIFEYTNGWQKKFDSPYSANYKNFWAYIAEYNGQIAFAVHPKPNYYGPASWTYDGPSRLWISKDKSLEPVEIESKN